MKSESPASLPAPPDARAHPLAFLGTRSTLKRWLLGGGGALLALGVWQSGIEPNGLSRAGLGVISGYLIGRVIRRFAKVVLLAVAALAGAAAIVGFTGLLPAEDLDRWTTATSDWLGGASDDLQSILVAFAPAGILTTIGVAAGTTRR